MFQSYTALCTLMLVVSNSLTTCTPEIQSCQSLHCVRREAGDGVTVRASTSSVAPGRCYDHNGQSSGLSFGLGSGLWALHTQSISRSRQLVLNSDEDPNFFAEHWIDCTGWLDHFFARLNADKSGWLTYDYVPELCRVNLWEKPEVE